MFFDAARALDALPELGARTRALLGRLLPGRRDAAAAQPRAARFPLACGADPGDARAARAGGRACSPGSRSPVLQSSANLRGGPDARRVADVPAAIRDGADLVVDAGELPGTPSTVIDLRGFEAAGEWEVVRPGAVAPEVVALAVSEVL